MKTMKKTLALLLAVVMALALAMPAYAASKAVDTTKAENQGTGKITVTQTSDTVPLNDRVFRAYKLLDVKSHSEDYENIAYTVPANMVAFFTSNNATGLNIDLTNISTSGPSAALDKAVTAALGAMEDDSAAIQAFAEKAQVWCAANGQYYEATGASDKVEFTNLPLGYYIVDDQTTPTAGQDTAVSAVILDTTTPNQTIVVKASTVPSDKEITGVDTGEAGETGETPKTNTLHDNDEDTKNEVVDVSVGDIVKFQVDSTVPDTRGYNTYKFVVNDTLGKGLKLDPSTIKITIGNDVYTVASDDLTVTTDPDTPTGADSTTLKIVLKDALAKFTKEGVNVGDAITVNYDAELTKDAPVGQKVENTVTIDYTNNPKYDYDGTTDDFKQNEPKGTTPEKKTETYTTELTIKKVDENGKPLAGAEFTLTGTTAHQVVIYEETYQADANGTYWKLADGSYTTNDPTTKNATDATKPEYDLTKYADYHEGDGLTEAAGYAKYSLVKSASPTIVNENEHRNDVKKTTGTDGVVTFSGLAEGTYVITETGVPEGYNGIDPITTVISFAYDETAKAWKFSATNVTDDGDNTFSVVVENNKGAELPSTGGIGTKIFYTMGAVLVIGAGVVLVSRKRAGE